MADPQQDTSSSPIDLSPGLVPITPSAAPAPAASSDIDLSPGLVPISAPSESTLHKLVAGPNTVLGTETPKPIQTELQGVSDIFHGNLRQGAGEIWNAENPVAAGSRLEKAIQAVDPNFKGRPAEEGDKTLSQTVGNAAPIDVAQFIDKNQHPIKKALFETAQSGVSPNALAMMASTGGYGMIDSPAALGMASRLVSAGFAANTVASAYKELKKFKEAYDNGDAPEAEYQLTHAVASGALAAVMAQHAATDAGPAENAWTKAGAKADQAVGTAINKTVSGVAKVATDLIPEKQAGVQPSDQLQQAADNFYKAIKPGKKMAADDFRQTLKDAMPQLSVVANKNPDVANPVEMAKAIEDHRVGIEAQIKQKAAAMRDLPEARMTDLQTDVQDAMREGWNKAQGKYTPDEIEKAEASVMKQLGIESKIQDGVPTPIRTAPIPDLYTAENIRQRFKDDTAGSYGKPGNVPPAEVYAKQVAGQAMRDAIDQKYEDLGIDGIKEWRKQEVGLIDVRDALQDVAARSDAAGKWNVWDALLKRKGWGAMPAMAGAVIGGAPGAIIGELAYLGADWWRDQATNPNVLTSKAVKQLVEVGPSEKAALPTKAPTPQSIVEDAGGTFKGAKDGLVEITLPRKMTDKLPIDDKFKDFVSVTLPQKKVTPEAVKEAMNRKYEEMGGVGLPQPELIKEEEEAEEPKKAKAAAAAIAPLAGAGAPEPTAKKEEKEAEPLDISGAVGHYIEGERPEGLVEAGNIDLDNRPVVQNADGSHSSEYSFSFGTDKGEVLVPTVVNGKFLTPDGKKPPEGSQAEKDMFKAAQKHYEDTGENLGVFDTPDHADAYAERVHNRKQVERAYREESLAIPDILDKAAETHGIPAPLLHAQARQESGLNPNAVSPKGAMGILQLMPRTAETLGVDPNDTAQNIDGGAKYMAQLHDKFGTWDKALAAYNWGPDRVQNAIDKYGDHWLDHSPEETRNYVHSILRKAIQ